MSETEDRIKRTYDVSADLYAWLEKIAKDERRPVIRQVEVILERARADQENVGV